MIGRYSEEIARALLARYIHVTTKRIGSRDPHRRWHPFEGSPESDPPPSAVILLDDVIEKLREPSRLERVDGYEFARGERASKAF